MITIYLGKQNKITIGELTTIYSQKGYGGVNWMAVEDDEIYGKLPILSGMMVESEDEN